MYLFAAHPLPGIQNYCLRFAFGANTHWQQLLVQESGNCRETSLEAW
jgi:hypothetical protein